MTYISVLLVVSRIPCSSRWAMVVIVILNDFNPLFLFWGILGESNFLLGDNYIATVGFLRLSSCIACIAVLLLFLDLGLRVGWVQMVRDEGVGEFVAGDRHRQQLGDPIWQEGLLQDLAHTWPLLRLFDQHLSNDTLQVFRVRRRNGWVVAAEDLEYETLHRVCVEGVPQRNHLIQDAAKRPNIWLLVVGLLLADLGWQIVWCSDSRLGTVVSVLQDASNSKVTDLDLAALSHENVLGLEVTMEDFPVVDVLDSEGHLHEPVQYLILTVADYYLIWNHGQLVNEMCWKRRDGRRASLQNDEWKLTSTNFLLISNLGVEITTVSIVHDDAETALVHEGFLVGDDVWVAHGFQNVHLLFCQNEWNKKVNHYAS